MLDALSTTFTNTFILLIKSFRLSSLFPALCFVVISYLLFLPPSFQYNIFLGLKNGNYSIPLFPIFLLTALIGYILNYLNFPLIYLAEGYPFRNTWWGQLMIVWYKERKAWLKQQAEAAQLPKSERRFYQDHLVDSFPPDPDMCAPTALGNVIAAFEAYPSRRYGIDAVHMWPRLLPVLNEEKYAIFVEREKEGFDFFLNFSILSSMLAVESVLLRMFLEQLWFTWVALASGCAAFLFYQAAVRNARNWGETIKTAFDLYRYRLAEQLALEPFEDKVDETRRWQAISYFIKRGSWDDFRAFRYPLPGEKKAEAKGEVAQPEAPSGEAMEGEAK
jgi:hypothetical protein